MEDDDAQNGFVPSISVPADRKRCFVCEKFVYFHQPILCCSKCRNVFHGTCLKFANYKTFILQQIKWYCKTCSDVDSTEYCCETCFAQIDLFTDNIAQCKQCFKITHKNCIKSNVCLSCLPVSLTDFNYPSVVNIDNDFYRSQPYFSPFQFYCHEVLNFVPNAEVLSDNLQQCSEILNSCEYYTSYEFKSIECSNSLSFISLNVDGFKSNFDTFIINHNTMLSSERTIVDGYFLCETNVTESESSLFNIAGYNKFILDRICKDNGKLKHKGSGLAIYLHEKFLSVFRRVDLSVSTPNFEILCVEVILSFDKFFMLCCYRSPSGNFEKFIEKLNEILIKLNDIKDHKSYILGDFNVNLYNSNTAVCRKYLDCIFSNNFLPVISRATHFGGMHGTCIDHILTNDLSSISKSGILRCNISRHFPTFVILDVDMRGNNIKTNKHKIRVNDFVLQKFIADFKKINFDYDSSNASDIYSQFHQSFKELYDKWFIKPVTTHFTRKPSFLRNEWISIGLAKSSDIKNQLYDTWVSDKNINNWNKYISYKRVFDSLKNKERFNYYDKAFKESQQDLKKTWSLINSILGRKRSNKLLTFSNHDAAHNFNSYFVNIADDLIIKTYGSDFNVSDRSYDKYMCERQIVELTELNFTTEDVGHIISKLNNSKGTYFSPKILKLLSPVIGPVLANIFNLCVRDGYFPKELKVAKVIPLYKNKGSINDISNYRPISMLSVFSKIFEKLIHKEVSSFFDTNNLFSNCQYGFRPKHSTVHALINAVSNLQDSIDCGNSALGIFIDFSKAFDTVNHTILLRKLDNYGIRGNVHKLLSSYLSDRYQYVTYGGLNSTLLQVTCGVPQGSVLGPLLFIIFINDISNVNDLTKYVLFADDLNMFLANNDRHILYQQANQVLLDIYNYCFENMLIINFDKCCYIDFSRAKTSEDLFIGILNIKFKQVDCCKFLGVYINSYLNWNDQIKGVINQVSKSCGTMYSIRLHVPPKILRQVYLSLIQPYLTYCIPLWGANFNCQLMQQLFVLQKKCIRIVSRKTEKINGIFQHTKPLFFRLNLLTVSNLFFYFSGCITMRILNQAIPVNIFAKFTVSERSYRLIYPIFKSTKIKNYNFIFNSSKILNYLLANNIPYHILPAPVFKKRLKVHLMNMQNTSIDGDVNWLLCNHDLFSHITV